MARARLLKPSFFVNDDLAEVHPLGRLLFQALWCLADRAGRLADKPARIKVQALPYDDCDVDALLDELAARRFILRYAAGDGERYIQVVNFARHQTPHIKEAASTIPAPDPSYICASAAPDYPPSSTVLAPDSPDANTGLAPPKQKQIQGSSSSSTAPDWALRAFAAALERPASGDDAASLAKWAVKLGPGDEDRLRRALLKAHRKAPDSLFALARTCFGDPPDASTDPVRVVTLPDVDALVEDMRRRGPMTHNGKRANDP